MIGPFVNSAAVILGSVSGAYLGDRVPHRLRRNLPQVFGCASMGLGVALIVKVQTLPPVVLALLLGAVIGELVNLEGIIQRLAGKSRRLIDCFCAEPASGISHDEFMDKFVAMVVLFCASGMGVFGSMNEGMTGDPSLLVVKAFLDFFTAMIFATSLGFSLAVVAVPQFLIQTGLYYGASSILPLVNDVMVADFSAVGGMIMLATGFRICGIASFPIANMLPALFVVMPLSALWMHCC